MEMNMKSKRKFLDPVITLCLVSLAIIFWSMIGNGWSNSLLYSGFPFTSQNSFRLSYFSLATYIILFILIFYYFPSYNYFRSIIMSGNLALLILSTIEFYAELGGNVINVKADYWFFYLTTMFLLFGFLNFRWKVLNLDPVLISMYLGIDSLSLLMWLNYVFGWLPSILTSIVLALGVVNIIINHKQSRQEYGLTL